MKRTVQPEILDSLPENHPDALANRRDLQLINSIMGNYRWFCRQLPDLLHPDDRILEIGAGTGALGFLLRERLGSPPRFYCGLDLWSPPQDWPLEWEWQQEDLAGFDGFDDHTVLLANLILHQFDEQFLRQLGEKIRAGRIRLLLANEPARHRLHQKQLLLLRPLGLNAVSRHDGHVSVAAGFRGRELVELLGLREPEWETDCQSGFFGWHRTVAVRKEPVA
jgi:hypothetical protein